MESAIAFCGLDCGTCPIRLASLEVNPDVKAEKWIEIADMLARIYNINPKQVVISDCDGCKVADGRLFSGCADCEIRKCAMDNNLENCAYCKNYPCDTLKKHFTLDSGARNNLEKIRGEINGMLSND